MKKFVYNYAIIRFMPYRETGEFVNVGVIISCPQIGYLDFRYEQRHIKRINDFFPELNIEIYKKGKDYILNELARCSDMFERDVNKAQMRFGFDESHNRNLFNYLTSTKEGLFIFSEAFTGIIDNLSGKLDELYKYYVCRNFAQFKYYQESNMNRSLHATFRAYNLSNKYRPKIIGDDEFKINMPFVSTDNIKAIKPLHLAHAESTKIYEHGDSWVSKIKRLRNSNNFPQQFLFAVNAPQESKVKPYKAYKEIVGEFQQFDFVTIIPFKETSQIIQFAI